MPRLSKRRARRSKYPQRATEEIPSFAPRTHSITTCGVCGGKCALYSTPVCRR